jgi:multimeric flavodoxin WrbA
MNALVLDASPNMGKGNTALILNPFIEGMKEKGAQIDLLYVRKLKVNACQGDQSCWVRTPGKCFQDDDMQQIYPKRREADLVVLATPVYVDGMTGALKNIIDRLIPTIEPSIELREGHCRHPPRAGYKHAKAVLVSTCGFWEMDNFAPLVAHVKAICENAGWKYAGALLRPHSSALGYMLRRGLPAQDVVEAAKEAGKQIAGKGYIEEETIKTIGRELVPLETYVEILNQSFKRALDSLEKP